MNPISRLGERTLITVIDCGQADTLNSILLQRYIVGCLDNDDVFRKEFLEHILITSRTQRQMLRFPEETRNLFFSWGTKLIEYNPFPQNIPPGPYVGIGKSLWPALRLYEDIQDAFLFAIKPYDMTG